MKKITKELLNSLNREEVIKYFETHTNKETIEYFGITRRVFDIFLENNNITSSQGGSSSKLSRRNKNNIINNLNIEQLITFYNSHSTNQTLKEFNISEDILYEVLDNNNIDKHTKLENTEFTNLEKYGCKNIFQSSEIKEKIRSTNISRYGAPHAAQNADIKLKIKTTNISKYGVTCTAQAKEVKEKIIQTNLERYGAEHYWSTTEGTNKCQITKARNHWDIENNSYTYEYNELRLNKEKSIEFLTNNYLTRDELAQRFNCSVSSIKDWLKVYNLFSLVKPGSSKWHKGPHSDFEDEVIEFIKSFYNLPIIQNNRKVLDGKEIDIFIPDKNIGIECNGIYWHSDLYKDKKYHIEKSKLAESKNIRLIHIYEYEWYEMPGKIKSLLEIALGYTPNKIYARECEIRKITNAEAKPFNNKNHIQGHRNAQVTYGLFYKDELVQLMSFSKNPKYEWEIIRGCPASNNIVVGGISKLFSHFIKDYNPSQVFSYCDFNKFDGHGYEALGMHFIGYTGPDKRWVMCDGSVINRNPHKNKEYKELSEAIIWGSGSKKYLVNL